MLQPSESCGLDQSRPSRSRDPHWASLKSQFSNSESEIKTKKTQVTTTRRRAHSLNGSENSDDLNEIRNNRQSCFSNDRDPLPEAWPEVATSRDVLTENLQSNNEDAVVPLLGEAEYRRVNDSRNQRLILSSTCISPTANGQVQGKLKGCIDYIDIIAIRIGSTAICERPVLQLYLKDPYTSSPQLYHTKTDEGVCSTHRQRYEFKSYIFMFSHTPERDHCKNTIRWRCHLRRTYRLMMDPDCTPDNFEIYLKRIINSHKHYNIRPVSANDSIQEILSKVLRRASSKVIQKLCSSSSLIKSLEDVLAYHMSPELCHLLELHCASSSKTRGSERVILNAVYKGLHHYNLHQIGAKWDEELTHKGDQIRAAVIRLCLVYLNFLMGGKSSLVSKQDLTIKTPTSRIQVAAGTSKSNAEPQVKMNHSMNIREFISSVHGGTACPHLLTPNNLFMIARVAISQCFNSSDEQSTTTCLVCPSHCHFSKRMHWAKLGMDILYYATDYDDWKCQISELVIKFQYLTRAPESCRSFGKMLRRLLLRIISFTVSSNDISTWLLKVFTSVTETTVPKKIFMSTLIKSSECSPQMMFTTEDRLELWKAVLSKIEFTDIHKEVIVLKSISNSYFSNLLEFSQRSDELVRPSVYLMLRILEHNILHIDEERNAINKVKLSDYGRKEYEKILTRNIWYPAPGRPGGRTRLSFQRGATNEDVEREIANNRGGDVLEVDLAETQINDDIANSLSKMPKLSKIDLSQTSISDATLKALSCGKYSDQITELYLSECLNLSPDGMSYLTSLTSLSKLILTGTKLTSEVCSNLKKIPSLRKFDYRYTDA